MDLYVIRHADAGNREEWPGDDADRPLSPLGHRQARALGEAFRDRGMAVDAVVSSPLVRTRQTAESFLGAFANPPEIQYSDLLAPGELLRAYAGLRVVAFEDGFLESPARFVQRIAAVHERPGPTRARYTLSLESHIPREQP